MRRMLFCVSVLLAPTICSAQDTARMEQVVQKFVSEGTFTAGTNPDVLDQYVGIYTIPGTPARMRVTRDGGTLFLQPVEQDRPSGGHGGGQIPDRPGATVQFEAAKDQMTIKRPQGERVFTKEK